MKLVTFLLVPVTYLMAANSSPETPKKPVVETIHGVKITDNYRWLEDQESPRTREWVKSQMGYTKSFLDAVPGRARVEKRLGELMRVDSIGVPHEAGGRYFYSRRAKDASQPMLCLRQGLNGAEEVLVDGNKLGKGKSASLFEVSNDGKMIAFGIRQGGEDEVNLKLMNVDTRRQLEDDLPRARYYGIVFAEDHKGYYYATMLKEGPRVYYRALGDTTAKLIFGERYGNQYGIGMRQDDTGRYILFSVWLGSSGDHTEVYLLDMKKGGPVRVVVDDLPNKFSAAIGGDEIFFETNWKAPKGRVMAAKLSNLDRSKWREVIPEGPWPLENMHLVGGNISVTYLENVVSKIRVYSTAGKMLREVAQPGIGTANGLFGRWGSNEAFYQYQSVSTPPLIQRYQVTDGATKLWAKMDVPFNADQMDVKQVWYSSKDGTKIPMFLTYKKGLQLDGNNPVFLTAYGGFNISMTPTFSATAAYWAENGGVFAVPSLRGGGEFGEEWHKAGTKEKKQNVFDDFIAAAEYLIANKYTRPEKLAISGGSNGGLLVGAVELQRPDLYGAVLCNIPLLDMVRYHMFKIARFWVPEYGSSEEPDQFQFIRKYSPYHNVKEGVKYPATMFISGDSDTRVDPLHARKMAALMQSLSGQVKPMLLHYDTEGGHSGGLPIEKIISNAADNFLFVESQLGIAH